MKFLDSNILAYAFYDNQHTQQCQQQIYEGGVVDTFNLVEAFAIIEHETGMRDLAVQAIKDLMRSNIKVVDVDVNIVFAAMKKIQKHKLSIFDMVHYICASLHNCNIIISYDKDFDNLDIPREEP